MQLRHRHRVELLQEIASGLDEAVGQVVGEAADPVVVVEQARATGPLEEVEDLLAVAQQVEERGEGPDVHRVRPHGDAVRGDALQLRHDHADRLAT